MKTNQEIANEVIKGLWGNGEERFRRLTEAGYNAAGVQSIVNAIMAGNATQEEPKEKFLEVELDMNLYDGICVIMKG